MPVCQVIILEPTPERAALFRRHAAAARIARNDLIAVWKDEGRRLPGFRCTLTGLRLVLNAAKDTARPWFRALSRDAVKGGYIDAEDAIGRYYAKQSRRPRFHGKASRRRFRADNGVDTVQADGKRLIFPRKLGGAVRVGEAVRWSDKPVREGRVSELGGRWYASIGQEIGRAEDGVTCSVTFCWVGGFDDCLKSGGATSQSERPPLA